MEIDLSTLQSLFEHATITSELKELAGHDLVVSVDLYGSDLQITVQDTDTFNAVATIRIPVKTKTTVGF